MRAVMERIRVWDKPQDVIVWHAAVGPKDPEALWQPIRCGGGISFPGHIEQRPKSDICPECLATPVPRGKS